MSTTCQLTGKRAGNGFNKSHSNRRTKRKFRPNLQEKKVTDPKSGLSLKLTLSTKAIKTLKKWDKAGKVYDLQSMTVKR